MKALIFILLSTSFVLAQSLPDSTNNEINFLLQFVKKADVVFIKNGSEYTALEAVDHIQKKYHYYEDDIKTAEDFIRLSATKSMLSGRIYEIRKPDGKVIPTHKWLNEALQQFRLEKEKKVVKSQDK